MVLANGTSPIEDFPKAMNQIQVYLNEATVEDNFENAKSVKVNFTINSDSEIVILDVRTKDLVARKYIKSNLDRKQLNSGDLIPGKLYSFYVLFK